MDTTRSLPFAGLACAGLFISISLLAAAAAPAGPLPVRITFYCSKGDPHPTDAGYRAMADAFLAAFGYPRNAS